jgi:ABC-2 type transport system ATP-binding protein
MIEIKDLTMTYPNGRGIFNIDFTVPRGAVVGFLGPNGAGKTSTIRCLLGFARASGGACTIGGLECFENAPEIAGRIGFIAGEPAFPDGMTGTEYLNFLVSVRAKTPYERERMENNKNELIKYLEFSPRDKIKRMSKGMKQKTAIVAAFMHEPEVFILDEPSSGLDPLMQRKFVDLILKQKQLGKTVLMSSHMFNEIEHTADSVVIIKDGKIITKDTVKNLKTQNSKIFVVESPEIEKIKGFEKQIIAENVAEFMVTDIQKFLKEISRHKILELTSKETGLEQIFMTHYGKEDSAK